MRANKNWLWTLPFGSGRAALAVVCLAFCAALATPAQAQTFGCAPAMANEIVCENSKAGAPTSSWTIGGAGDPSMQGFATDISFNRGQTAFFKIKTDAAAYRLDIFRMGYYGGAGMRFIATVNPSASLPQSQPDCLTDSATRLYDCGNWDVSASWNIPANATSGIYFAVLVRPDTGGASHIVFIVRDDDSHSDIVYQTPDETWQAYNNYGGHSLYGSLDFDAENRAYKVSYNRPFNTVGFAPATWIFNSVYPMVRWLEANGYDVSYMAHADGVRNASLLLNHKLFTSNGQDEYWTGDLRANVEAARDAGVHLAFFSGNEIFWKTRWENSIDGSGTPYRTLVCYKETLAGAKLDPMANVWTGTWRDPRFTPPADGGRPENSLTGTFFMVNFGSDNYRLPITVPAADGKMRFWRNTTIAGLSDGQSATLPAGTLGYEWDVADDNGFRPAGLFHLSTTTQDLTVSYLLDYGGLYGAGTATHHLTMYRASSGALVFSAGTVQWSWGLDSNHSNPYADPIPPASADMQQAMVNLFADMGVQPATMQGGLLQASQSTDTIPPASTITSPVSGQVLAVGTPFTVTGTALDFGGGVVGGVEVSTDNGQTWHPASGRENWTYSFTPAQMGPVTFMSRAVDDGGYLETPGSGVAAAVGASHSISGTITPAADGSGALVTSSGAWSGTTTADSDGNYTFDNLANGDYNVTPSKAGYTFSPASTAVTILDASVGGVDFTASQSSGSTYSISGSVTPTAYGNGVTITLTGAATATAVADASGQFSFSGLMNGSYQITPSQPGLVFSPAGASVTVSGANISGIAFTATPIEQTLFTTQVPAGGYTDGPTTNYELGTEFQSAAAGRITAIRFWKDSRESGTHVGRIWANTGELLASVTFTNETSSGWQRQDLGVPLTIVSGTMYIVTVNTGNAYYVATPNGLDTQVVNGDLKSIVGGNGVYGPPGAFPTLTWQNTNYFRDIVFVSSDASALVSLSLSQSTVVGGTSFIGTVTLSQPAPAGGAAVTLLSSSPSATVPGSVTVATGTTSASFVINTSAVGATDSVVISAIYNNQQSATLVVNPPSLTSLSLDPVSMTGGTPSTGTVILNGPAPSGGATVALSSDSAAAGVPPGVTVPQGALGATFTVTTGAVGSVTAATITGSYNGAQTGTLTINPPVISGISLSPSTVVGGSSSTGTVALTGPAPAGGVVVALSSNEPSVSGIQGVWSSSRLTPDGSVDWTTLGPEYSMVASGTSVPVAGTPGLNMTISTASGLPMQVLTSCATGGDCGWYGNFAVGASVLWVSGTYSGPDNSWAGNGPLTIAFSRRQRGVGMQIMADESGAFSATLCAYNNANALIGCVPFTGNGTGAGDNSAVFVGLYDDVREIAKVTIDAGGALNPHDFAIGSILVADAQRQMVPASVTVPAGATSATFAVSTNGVSTQTDVTISASYNGTQSAVLTIVPAALSSLSLNPSTVAGGTSSTGTVTLTGAAPVGGVEVALSSSNPIAPGVVGVYSPADLPQGGSIDWASLGSPFSNVDSGTAVSVAGLPGLTMTFTTGTGLPMQLLTNCSAGEDCGWWGNFAPGASVLWTSGAYDGFTGWWAPNGPLSVTFSSPQRGLGFRVMADELGPFTATLCAYDASDTLLGCVPFQGNGSSTADNSAVFVGIYDDAQEISKVTIDAGGLLYPHDFVIGSVLVTGTRKPFMPTSVTVPGGAASANFAINTSPVSSSTVVNITATYGASHSADLTVNPAALANVSVSPASVAGGTALTGTVTLTGAAPAGGAVVTLSANNPPSTGLQSVIGTTGIPRDGSVDWSVLGPAFTSVDSGVVVPVTGLPGSTVTVTTSNGLSPMILANCPTPSGDCGFWGNFVPADPLLWVGGVYDDPTGSWTGNGPLTLTFNTPHRGVGFRVMADEAGPFSGTVCAYNAADALLGCVPFTGTGALIAGGINDVAAYVGVYDDTQEIAKVIIDGGGALYPHDFAISRLFVADSRRMVPPSVKVEAGASSATFPINTDTVQSETTVTVSGEFGTTDTATVTITP